MLKWPAQPDSLYTIVLSNLDINSRRNRFVMEKLSTWFSIWFIEHCPSFGIGLLPIFQEILLMTGRSFLIFSFLLFCLKEMETIGIKASKKDKENKTNCPLYLDMDILFLNNLANLTMLRKEDQQILAVHKCPMVEDHSSINIYSWKMFIYFAFISGQRRTSWRSII